ncbi:MAG: tetratricopeptide repeat protein [Candidatus Omnitrophota bacterium]
MSRKKTFLALTAIFLISLVIRVIYINRLESTPIFGFFAMDAEYYDRIAMGILKGYKPGPEVLYSYPLYPVFLSVAYFLFGHALKAVCCCQAVIDSVTAVILYFIAAKVFRNYVMGLAAAFIYALYGMAVFYAGFLLDVTLVTFFYALSFLLILRAEAGTRYTWWLLAGISTALAMLLKAGILLCVPVFAVYAFLPSGNRTLMRRAVSVSLLCAGILLAAYPFAARNLSAGGGFSPFPAHGGLNFYIGNHDGATGAYAPLDGVSNSPVTQIKSSVNTARKSLGKDAKAPEVSRYWSGMACRFIAGKPGVFLALTVRKFFLFWNAREIGSNMNIAFAMKFLPILKWAFFSFGIVGPFAFAGLIFAAGSGSRDERFLASFIVMYMVSVLLYFVAARLRFICIPFMISMAVSGGHRIFMSFRSDSFRDRGYAVIILVISLIVVHQRFYAVKGLTQNYEISMSNLGNIYSEKGMLGEAVEEYKKAIRENPDYAEAHNNLGAVYLEKGMSDDAIREFKEAIRLNRDYAEAYYNLGLAYAGKGLRDNAVTEYKKAIEVDPEHVRAHYNLGYLYGETGMTDNAVAEYEKVISIDPAHYKSYFNLAVAYYGKADFEKALYYYNKAVRYGSKGDPRLLSLIQSEGKE